MIFMDYVQFFQHWALPCFGVKVHVHPSIHVVVPQAQHSSVITWQHSDQGQHSIA